MTTPLCTPEYVGGIKSAPRFIGRALLEPRYTSAATLAEWPPSLQPVLPGKAEASTRGFYRRDGLPGTRS